MQIHTIVIAIGVIFTGLGVVVSASALIYQIQKDRNSAKLSSKSYENATQDPDD